MIFKHKKYLFEVQLYFMKTLRLHNVIIHINFYQNRFINEYARKKKLKSWSQGVTESRSPGVFLVRYRRTYVLNNLFIELLQIKTLSSLIYYFIQSNNLSKATYDILNTKCIAWFQFKHARRKLKITYFLLKP